MTALGASLAQTLSGPELDALKAKVAQDPALAAKAQQVLSATER
jgi:hypothetical protein